MPSTFLKKCLKIAVLPIIILALLFSASLFFVDYRAIGSKPSGEHLEQISKSPQYDLKRNKFINRRWKFLDEKRKEKDYWESLNRFLLKKTKERVPSVKLPGVKPELRKFVEKPEKLKFIWLGHSTFLVHIGGKVLLFDPVFSQNASPVAFFVKRFQKPVLRLEDLPKIDYIVFSHDHYDHLDRETVVFFKDKKTKFIMPLGVSSHLIAWGIEQRRVEELDWWESITLGELQFICTPSQHFSGRTGFKLNFTLWSSWIVKSEEHSLFFSGDSGYDTHFKEIGDKHGPFDLTFMENGQYNEMWRENHLLPDQTLKAFKDVQGQILVPVHWGMFSLAPHAWYDPVEKLTEHAQRVGVYPLVPRLGELVVLGEHRDFTAWWKPFMVRGQK